MKVSDEMFEQMLNAFVACNDSSRPSLKAAIAVLPDMYTMEQVESAIIAAGWGHLIRWEIINRLTQQTPAAPEYEHVLGEKAQAAAHNERVENSDRYTDAPKSTAITEQECKHSHIVRWQKDGEWVCICRHCGWMAYQSITSKSNPLIAQLEKESHD